MAVLQAAAASPNAASAAPALDAVAVTPSDSTDLPGGMCRALYIGTPGNLVVDTLTQTSVTFTNVPSGILPVQVKRVRNASTTAANIIALY